MFDFTIKNRLIFGFLALVVIVATGIGAAVLLSSSVQDRVDTLVNVDLAAADAIETAQKDILGAEDDAKDYLLHRKTEASDSAQARLTDAAKALASARDLLDDDTLKHDADEMLSQINEYHGTFSRIVDLAVKKGLNENEGLQGTFRDAVHAVEKTINEQHRDELTVLMLMSRRHEKDYMLRGEQKYADMVDSTVDEFNKTMRKSNLPGPVQATIAEQWQTYLAGFHALVKADTETAAELQSLDQLSEGLQQSLRASQDELSRHTATAQRLVLEKLSLSQSILAAILAAATVLGSVLAIWIVRSISKPLRLIDEQITAIADGNLEYELKSTSTDELGVLMRRLDEMRLRLIEVIHGIKDSATQVSIAANQVSEGNSSLSERTQEQASSLEEIAASMEEMTSNINQNAENAEKANALSSVAREKAERGGEVIGEAVVAMQQISKSSQQISEIIEVINGIAFQTNLLSLNASVEAARAGDKGRGFAVVANEVRDLAARSATAAKEIQSLIRDSADKVREGVNLVNESGEVLREIVESVTVANENVGEIAVANKEQSVGISQVNQSVLQMDEMTQENASAVEEAGAAAEELSAQARELESLISWFRVESASTASRKSQARDMHGQRSFQETMRALGTSLPTRKQPGKLAEVADDRDWREF